MKNIAFLLLFLAVLPVANGQSCLEQIISAKKQYNSGQLDICIELVQQCSKAGNDQSVRWQAYRLKSMAYLAIGEMDSAKSAAEDMLELHPTYISNPLYDPQDFINLLKKIVIIPKFTLGLSLGGGLNTTTPQITKGYIVADYSKKYRSGNGFQLGTNIGLQLDPNWMIELGLLSTTKRYSINYEFTDWEINVDEKLNYLDIPLTAKYIFRGQKPLRFFLQAGGYAGILLYNNNNFQSLHKPSEEENKLLKLNGIDRRNKLNLGFTGGAGVILKRKAGHISLQANYYHSLNQINDPDKRYNYPEQIYNYYYLDDDIKLHNLAITVGVSYYLNYKVYKK